MIADMVTSIVRTVTPIIAGAIITFFASKGFNFDQSFTTNLYAVIQAIVSGLYYIIVRFIEVKFPSFGVLLGSKKAPQYTSKDQ